MYELFSPLYADNLHYDADSDYADIIIKPHETCSDPKYPLNYKDHNGYILINDNGDGMDEKEIINGWLKISLSKKKLMKLNGATTPSGRTPLGDKGLGRLSTQRLADKLELFTQKESDVPYHVFFNWNDFNEDTLLSKVSVTINELPQKFQPSKGTTLLLSDIKESDVWTGVTGDKIRAKLSQLISPVKSKKPFKVYFKVGDKSFDLEAINEDIKRLAISQYSFTYSENKFILLGKIKLAKLRGNDRANYAHLIESDSGNAFFKWLTDEKNKDNLNYLRLKYCGEKGVFIEFKLVTKIPPLDGSATVEQITSEVDKDGNLIKRLVFAHPGNFKGKIDEYEFVKDLDISGVKDIFENFDSYKQFIQNQTGIRVYRDGFGIRPFGLDGDDWLKLSEGQTSGSSFYGMRPGNVIGFISISAKANQNLKEKTDREGFIDNPYSRNFNLILSQLVLEEVNEILENIKRSYNSYRKKYGIDQTGLSNLSSALAAIKKTGGEAEALVEEVKNLENNLLSVREAASSLILKITQKDKTFLKDEEVAKMIKEIESSFFEAKKTIDKLNTLLPQASILKNAIHILEPQIETLTEQVTEFTELAGLGLIAESLSHEIDNILDRLLTQAKRFSDYLKKENIKNKETYVFIENVNTAISGLRKQISHLSPSLRYIRESKDIISVNEFLRELETFYRDRLLANAIKIKLDVNSAKNFEIVFNRGKLTQVFDNLLLNSEYWSKERRKTNKSFSSEIVIRNRNPFIHVFDNGFGIEPNVESRIFQPFVTTKPKNVGRGLGLYITQQLLENYGCDIVLLPDQNKYGKRYIFQLNFSNAIK